MSDGPGRVESINISSGGVPKTPVSEARVTTAGLDGDGQRDLRHHGGPDRAVSLYSIDLIRALQAEGHPIAPGSAGENLTISGIDWSVMTPGARIRIGSVRLVLTNYAAPCANVRGSFAGDGIARISERVRSGWSRVYARVLEGGVISVGDTVEVIRTKTGAP